MMFRILVHYLWLPLCFLDSNQDTSVWRYLLPWQLWFPAVRLPDG